MHDFGNMMAILEKKVSHHPPVSAYFYISPANKIRIIGELRPKSQFLGNSVATTMEGENRIFFMGRPEDGGESRTRICAHVILADLNSCALALICSPSHFDLFLSFPDPMCLALTMMTTSTLTLAVHADWPCSRHRVG